jgi:hypothetical protein
MIETKLQVVLNTLKEYNFQDAFKKMAEVVGMVHMHRRRLLQGWWQRPVGPKLVLNGRQHQSRKLWMTR